MWAIPRSGWPSALIATTALISMARGWMTFACGNSVPNPATATPTRTATRTPTRTPTRTATATRTPTKTPVSQPGKVYLPLVFKDYPLLKVKSGVHLGNRGYGDWNANHPTRLQGTDQGALPKAVVVLSSQLYYLDRPTAPPCKIAQARVKATELYAYLTDAIQNGTTVGAAFFGEFVPAAGSNLINVLILLPILLTAWTAAQARSGR